jgi:arginase
VTGLGPDAWELTGVPYTSMKAPGGIADAIAVLRSRGIAQQLGAAGVGDAGDLRVRRPTGERGPSAILNESALVCLVEATRKRVLEARNAQKRPLLVGADCPVLLGSLAAMRDAGAVPGLVMLDGHEDAWPPPRSDTGEGSDSEIAIALGRVADLPGPLDRLLPLLAPSALAFLGPRDRDELATAGVESLRDEVAFFADDVETSGALASGRNPAHDAIQSIDADEFWLHIDLDVLRSDAFAAVDYPQPGGLDWAQLERVATVAASASGCRGISVVIYNPDLDPDRTDAGKLIAFLSRLIGPGSAGARRARPG